MSKQIKNNELATVFQAKIVQTNEWKQFNVLYSKQISFVGQIEQSTRVS